MGACERDLPINATCHPPGMCHSAAFAALYSKTSSPPPSHHRKRPRGQSGSRSEAGAKWSLSEDRTVSQHLLSSGTWAGLRGSRVLCLCASLGVCFSPVLVAWGQAERRTISPWSARSVGVLLSSYSSFPFCILLTFISRGVVAWKRFIP